MAVIDFIYMPYLVFSQSAFKDMDMGLSVENVSFIFSIVEFVCAAGYFI
ncbi:protein of unknown function [Xenorhabdus poinarii G6]|uniref:Uncharacterized protein n=1 Tax=Xenorhabdus poinarii G6 TaxID=1354304 RepID=A0A068R2X0_9GAMM|nr:protein of unknown function [Xenorhabdus poinarii G6]